MNRVSGEALDALLAAHVKGDEHLNGTGCCFECIDEWPCTIYLLASEVRDARPVRDAAIAYVLGYHFAGDDIDMAAIDAYRERSQSEERELWAAVAHYEEGTK